MACLDLFIKLDLEIVNLSQGKKCSCPAPRLSLIYSCSKFKNLISKGFQVIAWTNLEEEEEEEEEDEGRRRRRRKLTKTICLPFEGET